MAFSWLERGLATGALGVFYKDEPSGTQSEMTRVSYHGRQNGRAGNSGETVKADKFSPS